MTALSVIQSHCRKYALNVPTSVTSSADATVSQLFELLSEVLDEIVTESKFQVTTREATFVTVATQSQGVLTTLAPSGFQYIINETLFDRTLARPLYGPVSPEEWQRIKALPDPGPFYKYRIQQGALLFAPVPVAGHTIAFEYMSSWAVTDIGGVAKAAITADTDLMLFPDNILKRGLAFRWKQLKGLPYQSDEAAYYNLLNNYLMRDKTRKTIDVGNAPKAMQPGIFIPSGSWFQ